MRILFIASGNSPNYEIAPFIKSQRDSLLSQGLDIDYFPIQGKGLGGYLRNIPRLRSQLKKKRYDLIHCHYVLSGYVALLTLTKCPKVLSLMGSDAYGQYTGLNKRKVSSFFLIILTTLIQPFFQAFISKSPNIERYIYRKKISFMIPNGVDLQRISNFEQEIGQNIAARAKTTVLFLGDPRNPRKNLKLVRESLEMLNDANIELMTPFPVSHDEVIRLLLTCDVLVHPSFMEGSPNLVKEAMACNCPIVATNVGDVSWVIGDTKGCYVSSFDVSEFAHKLSNAIDYSRKHRRTNGRTRLLELELDSSDVALKIIKVYQHAAMK